MKLSHITSRKFARIPALHATILRYIVRAAGTTKSHDEVISWGMIFVLVIFSWKTLYFYIYTWHNCQICESDLRALRTDYNPVKIAIDPRGNATFVLTVWIKRFAPFSNCVVFVASGYLRGACEVNLFPLSSQPRWNFSQVCLSGLSVSFVSSRNLHNTKMLLKWKTCFAYKDGRLSYNLIYFNAYSYLVVEASEEDYPLY